MSEERIDQERPCLHCMMVELIDDFFAEYPAPDGRSDKVDTTEADEVIGAIAKTVAELTSQQDGMVRRPALAVFSTRFKAACASGIAVLRHKRTISVEDFDAGTSLWVDVVCL
jgi:hypothetical protein